MRRYGLIASATASLAIAAIIAGCSSDNRSVDPPATPTADTPVLTGASLGGGGWSPAVEAAAATSGKVTVCHSGNGKHFTQIDVSPQGARAHLGDPETGKGGHAADYRVSANTPCPPPATPGNVQVCKVAGVGVVTGTNFTFTLSSAGGSKTVIVAAGAGPAGTCVNAGDFRVGTTVDVREAAQQGVSTTGIVVSPAGAQQGTSDLADRSATVVAGVGTTTLTFTNQGPTGRLVICKVAGTGVTAGSSFSFTVGGQMASVAAGAAPDGTCGSALTLAPGAVTVAEVASTGLVVQSIAGTPAPTNVDLPGGSATTQITAGQETRITFTNAAASAVNSGTLTICKVAGTGVTAGTSFTFTAAGKTATVAAGAAPNGTCGTPITLALGAVTVTETAVAGTSVQAITGTPALPTNINLASRSATVQINAGQDTRITFTNVAP